MTNDDKKVMETVPELPEDFNDWCGRQMDDELRITYKRFGSRAEYVCMYCGNYWEEREKPSAYESKVCPKCKKIGILEKRGLYKGTERSKSIGIYQKTTEGAIVFREFIIWRDQGTAYDEVMGRCGAHRDIIIEFYRVVITDSRADKYQYSDYCKKWFKSNRTANYAHIKSKITYPGWKDVIKDSRAWYVYTLEKMEYNNQIVNALCAFAKKPVLEYLYKKGLEKLTYNIVYHEGTCRLSPKKKKLHEVLRLPQTYAEELLRTNGGLGDMKLYQELTRLGIYAQGEDLKKVWKYLSGYQDKNFKELLKFMSWKKALNRLDDYEALRQQKRREIKEEFERQKENAPCGHSHYMYEDYGCYETETLTAYKDYLAMKHEEGFDLSDPDSVAVHPRDVFVEHRKLIDERNRRIELENEKKRAEYEKKLCEEFSEIAKKKKPLEKKYKFENKGFRIVAPKNAQDIIEEGRSLHHCVGGRNYLQKHNSGTSCILFLRSIEELDKPLITIEVKDGDIIQWYGDSDHKPIDGPIPGVMKQFAKAIKKYNKK